MDLNRIINGLASSGIGGGLAGGVAGGALLSALASKRGKKTAKTLLQAGGLAAVGGLAWKAYKNYQQSANQPTAGKQQEIHAAHWRGLEEGRFAAISQQKSNGQGILLLRAMISAAMADGQLSALEQAKIFAEVNNLELTNEERNTLFEELANPWDIDDFRLKVIDPVIAIEVYTAAMMTVDQNCEQGRHYLGDLSMALGIPDPLVASLRARLQQQEMAA